METLSDTDLYALDFARLSCFFEKADLVKKLNGFIQSYSPEESHRSVLNHLKEFIRVLAFHPSDGKFIVSKDSIEYVSLNPAVTMKRLLDSAHKVVLASGTLEPTSEYDVLHQYFQGVDFKTEFSCNHLLPK
jgi:Rad3-related DNA helicase